ncbi:MAG: hypothetical protein D6696_03085 [Acidobacteria bacterium]|nr:MAG: hypothetical protein D6696_03085 [Acidobacteriota bacterium]
MGQFRRRRARPDASRRGAPLRPAPASGRTAAGAGGAGRGARPGESAALRPSPRAAGLLLSPEHAR